MQPDWTMSALVVYFSRTGTTRKVAETIARSLGADLEATVRAFLSNHARRLPKVAFFVTEGGGGDRRVFGQMAQVVGADPVATLALVQRDVERGAATRAIQSFVASLPRTSAASSSSAHRVS